MTETTLDDIFATNTSAEEDGVWVTLTEDNKFLIRAYSAKTAVDLREKLTRQYQGLLRAGGKIPDETAEDINLKVLAGGILADWKRTAPYSADAAYAEMKRLPRFANWVAQQSLDAQNYKDELSEDSAKNS